MSLAWHKILVFLRLRVNLDWAPPGLGPEVNHPYFSHPVLRCCAHCGGGSRHAIHSEPYDARRTNEVLQIERAALAPDQLPAFDRAWAYWCAPDVQFTPARFD